MKTSHAYGGAQPSSRSFREQEYDVFLSVTRRLKNASVDTAKHTERLQALRDNEKLWLEAAVQLFDEGNRLPLDLKDKLIALYGFVVRKSDDVRAGKDGLPQLIEINLSIMRGLKGST